MSEVLERCKAYIKAALCVDEGCWAATDNGSQRVSGSDRAEEWRLATAGEDSGSGSGK